MQFDSANMLRSNRYKHNLLDLKIQNELKEINKTVIHVLKYSWEFSGIDFCPKLSEQPQITLI